MSMPQLFGVALLSAAAPLASAANVDIYLSEQSDLTGSPAFGNAAITTGTNSSGSFFIYVSTDTPLLGVPLDIQAATPGVIEFTGINIFNPYLDPTDGFAPTDNFDLDAYVGDLEDAPDVRWVSTSNTAISSGDSIDRVLAFSFPGLVGLGLDPSLSGGLSDPRTNGSGDFAFAEVTYDTFGTGSTEIYVSVSSSDDLAITPLGADPDTVTLTLGAGESATTTGENGQGASGSSANLVADAVITVADVVALVGDYNGDGFVSQGDLDLVLLNWGDNTVPAGFNESNLDDGGPFDGQISQNELDGVLLNWGDGTPPSLAAIPEPASMALMTMGAAGLLTRRRGY